MIEGVLALHLIEARLLSGQLSKAHLDVLKQMRNELMHSQARNESGVVEVPEHLHGLIDAAFEAAENGDSPDDLVSMVKHGMNKNRQQEVASHGSTSRRQRAK
ncbi:hypothetical protein D9M70_589810 [compost metagenome]